MSLRKPLLLLALLCALLVSAQSKMNAGLQQEYLQGKQSFTVLALVSDHSCFPFLTEQSIRFNPIAGNIISLEADREQFSWLLSQDWLLSMEGGTTLFPASRHDEASNVASQVKQVQYPLGTGIQTPYTGKGVIVGIIDIGFQPDHPTFYDTNGINNRVVRYWDQLDNSGNPPSGFSYGSLHTTLSEMTAKVYTDELHGTHVAGIAAGSGFGSVNRRYAGVAYEAEMVFVNIRYFDNLTPASAKGDLLVANPAIIDGVKYIFDYADSVGKPAVINLSWGMHTGPHDGTSLFDQAIDLLTGPGKIFVGAGGNDGWARNHVAKFLKAGDTLRTMPYNRFHIYNTIEELYINLWGAETTDFTIRLGLLDTNGQELGYSNWFSSLKDTLIQDTLWVPSDGPGMDTLAMTLSIVHRYAGNDKPYVILELYNFNPALRRVSMDVMSDSAMIHAWNSGEIYDWGNGGFLAAYFGKSPLPGYTAGSPAFNIGENGGTGKSTLTIGAYNASQTYFGIDGDTLWGGWGNRSQFSSRGPTVDGRIKPDISAPGENVISAFNRHAYSPSLREIIVDTLVWKGNTEYWGSSSGTSMASPNASGVVALMLQADSSLDVGQIRTILDQTAVSDQETGTVPNNEWGRGKLNAYQSLLVIQGNVSVQDPGKEPFQLYPNPTGGLLTAWGVPGDATYKVYDLSGVLLDQGQLSNAQAQLNLNSGLYLFVVEYQGTRRYGRVQVIANQ